MSDCRIFVLLKLLSSDMNEGWGAHLKCVCVCVCVVCVKLAKQLTKIGDRSLYSKNTNTEWLSLSSTGGCWHVCCF